LSEYQKVGSQGGVAVPSGWELVEDRPRLLVAVELSQDHITIDRDDAINGTSVYSDPGEIAGDRIPWR
jgi:hypothetical protein